MLDNALRKYISHIIIWKLQYS